MKKKFKAQLNAHLRSFSAAESGMSVISNVLDFPSLKKGLSNMTANMGDLKNDKIKELDYANLTLIK